MAQTLELPSQEELLKLFYYDDCLRWNVDKVQGAFCAKAGDRVVGSINSRGYATIGIGRKRYNLSRIVYQTFYGGLTTDLVIDHINRDTSDNRVENLRAISQKHNMRNKSRQSNNSTGFNGVFLYTKKQCRTCGTEVERRYYAAKWYYTSGKCGIKCFSISKYGETKALRLACEYRNKMLRELKASGEWYDESHGK